MRTKKSFRLKSLSDAGGNGLAFGLSDLWLLRHPSAAPQRILRLDGDESRSGKSRRAVEDFAAEFEEDGGGDDLIQNRRGQHASEDDER